MNRRGFLAGIFAAAAAPAIIRTAGLIMPIKPAFTLTADELDAHIGWDHINRERFSLAEIVSSTLRHRSKQMADNVTANNALLRRLTENGYRHEFS